MRQRKSDRPESMLDRLSRKHAELADRVSAIDDRVYLTANDQAELVALKREKLAMKDAINAVRREH